MVGGAGAAPARACPAGGWDGVRKAVGDPAVDWGVGDGVAPPLPPSMTMVTPKDWA